MNDPIYEYARGPIGDGILSKLLEKDVAIQSPKWVSIDFRDVEQIESQRSLESIAGEMHRHMIRKINGGLASCVGKKAADLTEDEKFALAYCVVGTGWRDNSKHPQREGEQLKFGIQTNPCQILDREGGGFTIHGHLPPSWPSCGWLIRAEFAPEREPGDRIKLVDKTPVAY